MLILECEDKYCLLYTSVEIVYYPTRTTDTKDLIERGKDADIIAVSNLPLNSEVIDGCKKLKLLSVAFTGVDHIAMDACAKNGVTVCNCAGYSTAAVADLVFGMLISLYRNIIPCNEVTRNEGTKDGLVGFELEEMCIRDSCGSCRQSGRINFLRRFML